MHVFLCVYVSYLKKQCVHILDFLIFMYFMCIYRTISKAAMYFMCACVISKKAMYFMHPWYLNMHFSMCACITSEYACILSLLVLYLNIYVFYLYVQSVVHALHCAVHFFMCASCISKIAYHIVLYCVFYGLYLNIHVFRCAYIFFLWSNEVYLNICMFFISACVISEYSCTLCVYTTS